MTNISTISQFDYSSLDEKTCEFLQQQTVEIRCLIKRTVEDIFEIGQKLIEVKKRLGHGRFGNWLASEFDWTERTGQKFMNVAKRFKSEYCSELEIAPSALYLLAATSTPEPARQEALVRAGAGEKISWVKAKEIKQKYAKSDQKLTKEAKVKKLETSDKQLPENSLVVDLKKFPPQSTSSQESNQTRENGKEKESTPSKPEIIALLPKQESLTRHSQLVEPYSWWQLGENLIYCGLPDSPEFQQQLPKKVALSLAFPPSRREWPATLGEQTQSVLLFSTIHQGLDLSLFRELIKCSLELCTLEKEVIVVYYLQDPLLPLLIHNLECRSLIAEPDAIRCEQAIVAWKKTGKKAEKIEICWRSG